MTKSIPLLYSGRKAEATTNTERTLAIVSNIRPQRNGGSQLLIRFYVSSVIMEIEKIFNDLESHQMQESEEAKKKLIDLFMQNKDQWLVHNLMDYFLKTGSLGIMEVLVKVQPPHDSYIFDRLSEWTKNPLYRVQALNLFCFVVRKHPSWLYKVEKHRLFKDIFKLLLTEKDIVPLMSALLCIIALLPIIPNLVPNFLGDLFDIFAHLASWNCQNPNRLADDKLVHLQLGLQMLFHRLYGMYPLSFLSYLSEFIKGEKGAIFHHTIKPLLETVRVHPMLVTASLDSELNNSRWKEMEPHDVIVECAKLSLPVLNQDMVTDYSTTNVTAYDLLDTPGGIPTPNSCIDRNRFQYLRTHQRSVPCARFDCGTSDSATATAAIWSPYNEINSSGAMPLTPTPSFVLQLTSSMSSNLNNQMLNLTGSSPPEAAVEATPETTPLKDIKDCKSRSNPLSTAITNPHAVRAILISSQPSSPMRKESQFNFPDAPHSAAPATTIASLDQHQSINKNIMARVTNTLHDRMVQQMLYDRNNSQNVETCPINSNNDVLDEQENFQLSVSSPLNDKCDRLESAMTPIQSNADDGYIFNAQDENIEKICDDCNETERTLCTAGGLHIPTSRSIQLLAKGIKRRNRMASYCCNEEGCDKYDTNFKDSEDLGVDFMGIGKVRRTKSCSSISTAVLRKEDHNGWHSKERRLQKSAKMLAISTVRCNAKATIVSTKATSANKITQTVQTWSQNYESILFEMLMENNKMRTACELDTLCPQEILDQYIIRTIKCKDNPDAGYRMDQEQFQLLCLQLHYERYRREIHAERNRRLMGRSRDKRSLEMERDRLREQLKAFATKNDELIQQIDKITKACNDRHDMYVKEVADLKTKYQLELEQNKCLRQANESIQEHLNDELSNRKELNFELELLRGEVFNLTNECQHAQMQAEMGLQCKQELARLEAEFVVMGELQAKYRERLIEIDNFNCQDKEITMLQEVYNIEMKELKQLLDEKIWHLDSTKHKISELQSQLANNEDVITSQKRLLKTVKDEYEEKFKALNKKYEIQKTIIIKMEEKILSLQKSQGHGLTACSPDDKTDIASSIERNSPLSTSLASSESLSASLRSTELRNLQQLVEAPLSEETSSACIGNAVGDVKQMPSTTLDFPSAAINVAPSTSKTSAIHNTSSSTRTLNIPISVASACQLHKHPHLHLQQQQQKQLKSTINQPHQTNESR